MTPEPLIHRSEPGTTMTTAEYVAHLEAEVERLRARLALVEGRAHPMDLDSPAYD